MQELICNKKGVHISCVGCGHARPHTMLENCSYVCPVAGIVQCVPVQQPPQYRKSITGLPVYKIISDTEMLEVMLSPLSCLIMSTNNAIKISEAKDTYTTIAATAKEFEHAFITALTAINKYKYER